MNLIDCFLLTLGFFSHQDKLQFLFFFQAILMSLYVPQNSCSIIHFRNSIACSARMHLPLMQYQYLCRATRCSSLPLQLPDPDAAPQDAVSRRPSSTHPSNHYCPQSASSYTPASDRHPGQPTQPLSCSHTAGRPPFSPTFPALPPAPLTAVPILSPTSSCDSAPAAPIKHAPPQRPPSQASSTSTSSPPLPQPKRKREPPPPLNEDADWDAWDGDADVRLVELKTDARLRPNWNYVARRVGFSIEQCKARWEELQEPQRQHKAVILPPSPTPTSPANTPPASPVPSPPSAAAPPPPAPPSAPDFSYTPTTPPSPAPAVPALTDAVPATISEDSPPEPAAADIGSYFV